ncbi:bifunctional phosphopantothenoylcysteine decarboxylase/phosphopantothenate--cysteine ligase CoaBC [Brevibacillus sp. SYP-B805]|uniref:bifunctional phosphopantothenoylcysteine decarboxylase/phosphopantothenate--cysteine ligase CoaBC n=1 Tax=Brevibacillus sp. SYP-B805 TaxID=1578199 RepID=UPI0013EA0825|nr:bifunctional phosphopantothenoylcysteine decarboxylase/phosphopantothenate--cysteine ligase CoaBC [Brevibacillus sp. SYP-B805]NGQ93811.1 bifunctional phosphopantothenoylcysteine decarboxylase/phosphopantothenate--cysteine ligase CoaBC [Brevibacillus sp. SYP-B805]
MQALIGKNIVLGVTGGIAAYKAAALTSKLTQAGAAVHVILTQNARQFIQPLTFQALSHLPVYTDTFTEPDPQQIAHIDLADRADLVLIAPATANVIGKLANGIADDMLTTTLLATKAPVMLAPAMNVNMYGHPAVAANMKRLADYGYRFIEPGEGLLACGWVGKGRMAEPEEIVEIVQRFFAEGQAEKREAVRDLAGKRVLITAGPTRERIDPVRYISNHSSGKMGYALAEAARDRGADVVLVSGPTDLPRPDGVTFVPVESVQEMYDAVLDRFEASDIVVKAAAVSDYRPVSTHSHKMKKTTGTLRLELEKAPDILQTIGRQKTHQYLVGFAAETQDLLRYAQEKLVRKNADMIVANDVLAEGAGMGVDTNIVTLVTSDGETIALNKMSKREVADKIFDTVLAKMSARTVKRT